jgi:muramidase (phage lysozyme)
MLLLPMVAQPPLAAPGARPANERATETVPPARISHSAQLSNDEARRQLTYKLTPERRALLNTIRYAEGTWLGGSGEGYRVLYGGGRFAGFSHHPEMEVRRRYVSAAAGAYQFLPATWKAAAKELALPDFGPQSQDQAALHLVRKRGALHHFDREGLSEPVLARLAHEWASLPSLSGGSVYGQPVRSARELQAFFRRELDRQRLLAAA